MLLGENTIGNPEELILLSAAEGDLLVNYYHCQMKKKRRKKLSPRDC